MHDMSCLGTGELLMLGIILLIILSASRMGRLGDSLGRFVYSFKRASKGEHVIDVTPEKPVRRKPDHEA